MPLPRRHFLSSLGASLAAQTRARPNILWITTEDIGPALGCYGDKYADTPNLDALAARGLRYDCAWSNAPVCAPARTTLISGVYPTATGSEHMRSLLRLPENMRMYPQILRESGYYATNNSKEDYNLEKPGQVWDESSPRAHWRNRKPDQPFFAVFNFVITHESQIRTRPHKWVHDPAKARVPAYHPDTPEVRQDWAQYYDNITTMDRMAGNVLSQLESDGLKEDTIVFFYGDHGSGMPRSKRWPYNSGLQVPLLLHVPEKWKHLAPKDYRPGGSTKRLAAFVDLAPTLLSLAGIEPPGYMQGHALMGKYEDKPQPYLFGFRGRMDERYDLVRSARDERYVYLRQYMPHLPYGQHIGYMFETPTTAVWKKLYEDGRLNAAQKVFWEAKPAEELYDLQADRDEVKNLAADPAHRSTLRRFREAVHNWILSTRDVGFLPEDEIHSRSKGSTPYETGHDKNRYPLEKILAIAETASFRKPDSLPALKRALSDSDSAVRRWGILGIRMQGEHAVRGYRNDLVQALQDAAPAVRIAAAEALAQFHPDPDLEASLQTLIDLAQPDAPNGYVRLEALNAIDALGKKASPLSPKIEKMRKSLPRPRGEEGRATGAEYLARTLENIHEGLQAPASR